MSNKHTPGPWVIEYLTDDGQAVISDQSKNWTDFARVWVVTDESADKEGEANSRLIAAAPELLEALSKFVAFTEQHGEVVFSGGGMSAIDVMNACTTKARAAIAKATGGAA